jgi:hypothetical protein
VLSSLPPHIQQRLAVAVPLIALALSLFVVYPGWTHWRQLLAEADQKRVRLSNLQATPIPLPGARRPAAEDTPSEPPEFLADMQRIAAASGCGFVGFDLTLPPAPVSGEEELAQGGNKKPDEPKAPPLVKPVRAKIEVEADYARVRQFVQGIIGASRLYAIASLEVKNANKRIPELLAATVEIERYVLNPDAPPPAPGP